LVSTLATLRARRVTRVEARGPDRERRERKANRRGVAAFDDDQHARADADADADADDALSPPTRQKTNSPTSRTRSRRARAPS
jgi:hypothetical protein